MTKEKNSPSKKQFHLSANYYFYDVVNVEFSEIDVMKWNLKKSEKRSISSAPHPWGFVFYRVIVCKFRLR